MNELIRLEPNIKTAHITDLTGYLWGKEQLQSNILRKIGRILTYSYPHGTRVAERWIVSDDIKAGSRDTHGNTLHDIISKHPYEILGSKHVEHYGPHLGCVMKHLDTNKQKDIGSLSIQVHPAINHPTLPPKPELWLGTGSYFLGFKDYPSFHQISSAIKEEKLHELLNVIDAKSPTAMRVDGGVIHAIRYDSNLYEWSLSPDKLSIEKGGLQDSSIAYYDRTDGKKPRPNKEHPKEAYAITKQALQDRRHHKNELIVSKRITLWQEGSNKEDLIFQEPLLHVHALHLNDAQAIHTDRAIPVFVEDGALRVESAQGNHLGSFKEGSEFLIPASLSSVRFVPLCHDTLIYAWKRPFTRHQDQEDPLLDSLFEAN